MLIFVKHVTCSVYITDTVDRYNHHNTILPEVGIPNVDGSM